jgi:competence protein ComEC
LKKNHVFNAIYVHFLIDLQIMRPLLNEIRKIPFVRLLISLIAGVLLAKHLNIPKGLIIGLISFLLAFLILLIQLKNTKLVYRTFWVQGLMLISLMVLTGFIITKNRETTKCQLLANVNNKVSIMMGEVVSNPEEKNKTYKLLLKVNRVDDKIPLTNKIKVLCYLEKDAKVGQLVPGDIILFSSGLNPIRNPGNPGEFDFERYMSIQKVYFETYIKTNKWVISQKKKKNFTTYVLLTQSALTRLLNNLNLQPDNLAVLKALLLGEKTGLDPETMNAYINSGTVHILSVSGLHVGIIYLLLSFIFGYLKKNKVQIIVRVTLILIILWMYAFITGFVPCIQRATLMFTFILIGRSFNKEINNYNVLALSAFVLILLNPLVIYDVGFQLSYSAVLSIMIFYNPLYSRFLTGNKVLNYMISLMCLSISAQIFTFPIIIYYFNQFPTCFPIANLVVVPLVPIIMLGGMLLMIMSRVHLVFPLYIKALDFLISFMTNTAHFISELPYALIENIAIEPIQILFLYGCIVVFALFLYYRIARYLGYFLVFIIFMLVINAFINRQSHFVSEFQVYNIKGHSVMKLFTDNNAIVLCDKDFYNNSEWQNSKFLNKEMIYRKYSFTSIDSLFNKTYISNQCIFSNSRLILSNSKKIAIVRDKIYKSKYQVPENKLKVDYLLLSAGFKGTVVLVKEYFSFDTLIIDPSVSYYIQKQIIEECKNKNVNYIAVAESGAQKFRLN